MLTWFRTHNVVLGWLFGLSVAMFLGALVLVPIVVVRLPADYFAAPKRRDPVTADRPLVEVAWRTFKNGVGVVLVLAGISMLVLPGQGILTVLIGVSLMDFPGKYRLERWIIHFGPVLNGINALRRRYGRPPLEFGETKDD